MAQCWGSIECLAFACLMMGGVHSNSCPTLWHCLVTLRVTGNVLQSERVLVDFIKGRTEGGGGWVGGWVNIMEVEKKS